MKVVNLGLCFSLVFMLTAVQQIEASRHCFCQARVAGKVIKDFGALPERCSGWFCGCGHSSMIHCGTRCDYKVKQWATKECVRSYTGKPVQPWYKASSCRDGYSKNTYTCKPKPYCYKTSRRCTKYETYTEKYEC